MKGQIPKTPFCVDLFTSRTVLNYASDTDLGCPLLFFLSHAHADHMEGLSPSFDFGTIYCSPCTKAVVQQRFGLPDELVVGLEVGTQHLLQLNPNAPAERAVLAEVTLIDARHCPGSVMFLFRGYFGTVLHTGDFKFEPEMLRDLDGVRVDSLYLDNTFMDPRYRFVGIDEAVAWARQLTERFPSHEFVMAGDLLGKEDLMIALSQELRTLIVVDQERLDTVRTVAAFMPDWPPIDTVFSSVPGEGFIRLVPKGSVSEQQILHMNRRAPTVGIRFSGWTAQQQQQNDPTLSSQRVFCLAYSAHSSFDGICALVKAVGPREVFCTVPEVNTDMNHLERFMSRSGAHRPPVEVPQALQRTDLPRRGPVTAPAAAGVRRKRARGGALGVLMTRRKWKPAAPGAGIEVASSSLERDVCSPTKLCPALAAAPWAESPLRPEPPEENGERRPVTAWQSRARPAEPARHPERTVTSADAEGALAALARARELQGRPLPKFMVERLAETVRAGLDPLETPEAGVPVVCGRPLWAARRRTSRAAEADAPQFRRDDAQEEDGPATDQAPLPPPAKRPRVELAPHDTSCSSSSGGGGAVVGRRDGNKMGEEPCVLSPAATASSLTHSKKSRTSAKTNVFGHDVDQVGRLRKKLRTIPLLLECQEGTSVPAAVSSSPSPSLPPPPPQASGAQHQAGPTASHGMRTNLFGIAGARTGAGSIAARVARVLNGDRSTTAKADSTAATASPRRTHDQRPRHHPPPD